LATQYEAQQEFVHILCELIRKDGLGAMEAVKMFCNEFHVSVTYCVDFGITRTLLRVAKETKKG